jgi:hypothetical protein
MKERIMKKLLAMCLVLGMASIANAAVVELVKSDIGLSEGRTGGHDDPLLPSDVIGIEIVVTMNPVYLYPGYPSYQGYIISNVDLDLHAVGPGSLGVVTLKAGGPNVGTDLDSIVLEDPPIDVNGDIPRIQGLSLGAISVWEELDLVMDNILFHCDGPGPVLLDLTLFGPSKYADYQYANGDVYPDLSGWKDLVEEDLGDLVIYQIPEPITMTLLGIGGLALLRRRR